MRAIQVTETGGPEVMRVVEIDPPVPGPGQVQVTTAAAGLNFIDTYLRAGVYPAEVPFVLGKEGSGTVSAVGADVSGLAVGDRVMAPMAAGSYAEAFLSPAHATFPVPPDVDLETAAAVALQGLTAHYLVTSSYPLAAGDKCLIHAGAGGVGGLLIQMAKQVGAEVFTTVGTDEKADVARRAGADHVIVYTRDEFAPAVRDVIGPDGGLDVVYDGVGKSTFDAGLDLLRPRGTFVLFGGASGQVPPFDLQRLNRGGSLFITRPSLGHHLAPGAGHRRAEELLGWVGNGTLEVNIGARFSLEDAADAHRALEGRQTTGKVLLIP